MYCTLYTHTCSAPPSGASVCWCSLPTILLVCGAHALSLNRLELVEAGSEQLQYVQSVATPTCLNAYMRLLSTGLPFSFSACACAKNFALRARIQLSAFNIQAFQHVQCSRYLRTCWLAREEVSYLSQLRCCAGSCLLAYLLACLLASCQPADWAGLLCFSSLLSSSRHGRFFSLASFSSLSSPLGLPIVGRSGHFARHATASLVTSLLVILGYPLVDSRIHRLACCSLISNPIRHFATFT